MGTLYEVEIIFEDGLGFTAYYRIKDRNGLEQYIKNWLHIHAEKEVAFVNILRKFNKKQDEVISRYVCSHEV